MTDGAANGAKENPEGPNDGHRFRISVASAGSYRVIGKPDRHDCDWWSDPSTVEVRAWNLRDALTKVAALPFSAWFPEDDCEE